MSEDILSLAPPPADARLAYGADPNQFGELRLPKTINLPASGQLALCLAAHELSVKNAVSLAGVVDLQRAWELHLSNDAVVEFLGGKPNEVPDHYQEADPMQLKIPKATEWLVHGSADDVV